MPDIKELTTKIVEFNNDRDWKQFHNPKDLALSLVLEAAEVMEHFQWKNSEAMEEYLKSHKDDVGEELADVLYWVLLMSNDLGIDIKLALEEKMKKNEAKYPIEKAKGSNTKYNKL
jgi:NTP pyrophosphatase (non-canonical NTP hydrolase)